MQMGFATFFQKASAKNQVAYEPEAFHVHALSRCGGAEQESNTFQAEVPRTHLERLSHLEDLWLRVLQHVAERERWTGARAEDGHGVSHLAQQLLWRCAGFGMGARVRG